MKPRPLLRMGRGPWRVAALVLLLAAGRAAPLSAQEGQGAEPLSKPDVIRLLTADTYTDDEVARIVRRSCLSFRLTDRDRADFRELGASPGVIAAMEDCSSPPAPLELSSSPDSLRAAAGDTVTVTVSARRGNEPAAGVALTLGVAQGARGGGSLPSMTSTTSGRGVALFRFPAGTRPGRHTLRVTSADARAEGPVTVPLVVIASAPADVRLWPDTLTVEPDGGDDGEVLAIVTDRYGNAVPRTRVLAREGAASTSEAVASAVTDGRGEAVLRIPAGAVAAGDLAIWAEGNRLGSVPVRATAAAVSRQTPAGPADSLDTGVRRARTEPDAEPEQPATEGESADEDPPGPAQGEEIRPGGTETVSDLRRRTVEHPGAASAWMDLSRAWREAARPLAARLTLLRAREVASGAVRDSVDEALSRVYGLPPGLRVSALWGSTVGRDGAAGLRSAALRARVAPFMQVWGRYDRSLPTRVPALVRGSDLLDAYYGGLEVEWGTPARSATRLEAGRREYREDDLAQNILRIEQEVRFPTDRGYVRLRAGGLLGRWFDRDDWLSYARASIPLTLDVDLEPSVWVGETVGTDLEGVGREPGREVRGELGLVIRPAPGLRIEPSFGYGVVEAEVEEAEGSLWEGGVAVSIPVSSSTGLELVARHQSPPGRDGFTVLAGGLRFGLR